MSGLIDLTGQRFGHWTVLGISEEREIKANGATAVRWVCQCDCGTVKCILGGELKRGKTKSCGCTKRQTLRDKNLKHEEGKTRLYRTWANIKNRCGNPNYVDYHRYGGRGIQVCQDWENSYELFRDWARANGYWNAYNDNIKTLKEAGLSDSFLAQWADQTAEGVANAEDLANRFEVLNDYDTAKWAKDLNDGMVDLTTAQDTAAKSVGDMKTGYTKAAEEIQTSIEEAAENAVASVETMATDMNQSGTAWVSGNATGSAYRQALSAQLEKAIAEAQSAKTQINNALGSGGGTKTDWSQYNYGVPGRAAGGFTAGPTLAGEDPNHPVEAVISFDPKYHEENVGYLQQAAAMLGVTAGQTPQADAGYSFGGFTPYGELMLRKIRAMETNPETATAPVYMPQGSGTTAVIQNSNSITVTPGMTRQEVLDMLNANNESIVDMVFEAQERAERDRRRTSYGC